jgi:TatD DNase family protein
MGDRAHRLRGPGGVGQHLGLVDVDDNRARFAIPALLFHTHSDGALSAAARRRTRRQARQTIADVDDDLLLGTDREREQFLGGIWKGQSHGHRVSRSNQSVDVGFTAGHSAWVIDSHIHLNLLTEPNALADAVQAGVTRMIGIGTDPRQSPAPTITAPPSLQIDYALGLHPYELKSTADVDDAMAVLERRLVDEHACAIGETGLDHRPELPNIELQQYAFQAHLELRRRLQLPLILHGVRRDERMLATLAQHARDSDPPTIWHGFSSSKDTAVAATRRGIVISIGFMVLNERAKRVQEAVAAIPFELLLIETDAPPLPPARLGDVAAAIAKLRNTTTEAVVAATTANANRVLPTRGLCR